jgi:nitrogen fixation protein FixH
MSQAATRKSLWIPYTFVAFFGVVFAVNGVMVYFAATTFTGVDERALYKRGTSYNAILAAARDQAALGWTVDLQHAPIAASVGRLRLAVADSLGQPVSGADVTARIRRPTDASLDFAATMDADGAGGYVAEVAWPAAGLWDVKVTVHAEGRSFQLDERLLVP